MPALSSAAGLLSVAAARHSAAAAAQEGVQGAAAGGHAALRFTIFPGGVESATHPGVISILRHMCLLCSVVRTILIEADSNVYVLWCSTAQAAFDIRQPTLYTTAGLLLSSFIFIFQHFCFLFPLAFGMSHASASLSSDAVIAALTVLVPVHAMTLQECKCDTGCAAQSGNISMQCLYLVYHKHFDVISAVCNRPRTSIYSQARCHRYAPPACNLATCSAATSALLGPCSLQTCWR